MNRKKNIALPNPYGDGIFLSAVFDIFSIRWDY